MNHKIYQNPMKTQDPKSFILGFLTTPSRWTGPARSHGIGLIASTGSLIAHTSHPKISGRKVLSTDENGVPGHITLLRSQRSS